MAWQLSSVLFKRLLHSLCVFLCEPILNSRLGLLKSAESRCLRCLCAAAPGANPVDKARTSMHRHRFKSMVISYGHMNSISLIYDLCTEKKFLHQSYSEFLTLSNCDYTHLHACRALTLLSQSRCLAVWVHYIYHRVKSHC